MNRLVEGTIPHPRLFFPAAALLLALAAFLNLYFSHNMMVVVWVQVSRLLRPPGGGFFSLTASTTPSQNYIVVFHTGAINTLAGKHHPAVALAPFFFVIIAFVIISLRTNILVALVVTVGWFCVGWGLANVYLKPKVHGACRSDHGNVLRVPPLPPSHLRPPQGWTRLPQDPF